MMMSDAPPWYAALKTSISVLLEDRLHQQLDFHDDHDWQMSSCDLPTVRKLTMLENALCRKLLDCICRVRRQRS